MKRPRCSLIILCLLALSLSHCSAATAPFPPIPITSLAPRQADPTTARPPILTPPGAGTTPTTPTPPTPTPPTTTLNPNTSPANPLPASPTPSPQTPSTTANDDPSTTPPTSTPPANTSQTSTPPSQVTTPPTSPPTLVNSEIISSSTDAAGSAVEVTVTVQLPASSSTSSSAQPSSTSDGAAGGGSSGLGTGSIIGLSVAGGVAVIGIIAFIIWKVTRKRGFSDFDDSEAIKWPELNSHKDGAPDSHPLPTTNTGRAGFDTSPALGSGGIGGGLSRTPSISSTAPTQRSFAPSATTASAYSNVYNTSTPELYQDPYAVPPLPHLNPNQPYRDDTGAYYDPYRGPVPQALHDPDGPPSATIAPGGGGWDAHGEAIPMTQMAGRRSPGPAPGLSMYDAGRASPAPGGGGRMSPGPGMAYGGPGVGGGDPFGRRSPGPGQAYDVGRRSPGPYNAYAGQ